MLALKLFTFVLIWLVSIPATAFLSTDKEFVFNDKQLLVYLKTLSSDKFSGRKFATDGNKQAQEYIISTLKELAIPAFDNQYQHHFDHERLFDTKQGANIIGFIEGETLSEQYIVLSAHFDHLGNKGQKIFNGADDNASGTAALLTYASMIIKKPLNHSVILLFTDGEEVNLLGAKAFVSQQKQRLNQIRLNINLDMIAGTNKTKALNYIKHDFDQILSSETQIKFTKFQHDQSIKIKKGFKQPNRNRSTLTRTNWRMASDHAVFYQADIPFIYFGVGTHKNYHSVKDNYDNINSKFFIAATKSIYQQLLFLDKNIIFTDL